MVHMNPHLTDKYLKAFIMRFKLSCVALVLGAILISSGTTVLASPAQAPAASSMEMAYIPSDSDFEIHPKANILKDKLEKRTNEEMMKKLKQYFKKQKRRKKQKIV